MCSQEAQQVEGARDASKYWQMVAESGYQDPDPFVHLLGGTILMHGHAGQLPRGPMSIGAWC